MKLKTIQYSESYEYAQNGMKRWKKTGFEAELDDNEDPKEAHRTLRQLIDEIKAETIAGIESQHETKVTTIEENEPLNPLEKMKLAINSCTDITVLESFKLLVSKNKEGLQETYDNKLQSLKNK